MTLVPGTVALVGTNKGAIASIPFAFSAEPLLKGGRNSVVV
jgi:hypothetical protein